MRGEERRREERGEMRALHCMRESAFCETKSMNSAVLQGWRAKKGECNTGCSCRMRGTRDRSERDIECDGERGEGAGGRCACV